MEGTPVTIHQEEVKSALEAIDGVINVHDLHIWSITSGLDSLSCHVLIEEHKDTQEILQHAINKIKETFKIDHATIQIETAAIQHHEFIV
ncbi:Cadmium, cobalt and zinc/H(+)-K(+) antiporter [compost metagenome]